MLLVPVGPPHTVPVISGFDYVAADAARRRIYAAHTGSQALLIVDADNGKVLGQVDMGGPVHGVAVDPASGHVFTGDGQARTVSEVDPSTQKVLNSTDVAGNVDAIAYDPGLHRIYADEDDGTRIFVIDSRTMKHAATVKLPGHKPEYLAIDPQTHRVYQNIADINEIAVIDPATLKVVRTIRTPELTKNHPLQYDAAHHLILAGGKNGVLAAYTTGGTLVSRTHITPSVDQCDLNAGTQEIACAGGGEVDVVKISSGGELQSVATLHIPQSGGDAHTLAYDPKTNDVWVVWSASDGDAVQRFTVKP